MSGIYGIIDIGTKIDEQAFEKLSAWNKAYGNSEKSEEVVFNDESLCVRLGVNRENFKEENKCKSALFDENTCTGVYDTLLYDRGSCLGKENFSDEEFVFNICKNKDLSRLESVNGDFAGAFFDKCKKELVLFADHMGTRTLYYYEKDGMLVFSTDIRGITSIKDVDTGINEEWLYKTLSGMMYMNQNRTEYEHIYCVPAGSWMKITWNGKKYVFREHRYWTPGSKKIRFSTDEDYFKKLRELTENAIKIRLDAVEGKVGAELSGGLDSSVISILINRFSRECEFFSWSEDVSKVPLVENDERLTVFDVCKQENITCDFAKCSFDFRGNYKMNERVPLVISEDDEKRGPYIRYAFPPFMNGYPMVETAEHMREKGVRVIFTGHAGDEGISHRCSPYEIFYYGEYLEFFRNMWRRTYGQSHRVSRTFKKAAFFLEDGHKRRKSAFFRGYSLGSFLNPDFVKKTEGFRQERLTFFFDPKEYILKGGSRNRLNVVEFVGALCGVRYIAPYVDYRLIDFALGIPRSLYMNGSQNRYVYRMAFKDLMPKSLFKLQSKSDTSINNSDDEENDEEKAKQDAGSLKEKRRKIVYNVNRENWEKYIDYDLLDRWIEGNADDEFDEEGFYNGHTFIEMAENMVIKSRQVKIKED